MKKIVLIAAGLALTLSSFAQKSQIRTAKNYLGEKNFEKAKAAIEEATNGESKDDPYAWYVRGIIYLAMQQEPGNESKEYYNEAGKSFKKTVQLQSDYEKEDVNNKLFAVTIYNFNAGLGAFDKQNYEQAFKNFGEVVDIRNIEGGKRFGGKNWTKLDTIAHQSALYQGYSAYYSKENRYDEALPLLIAAKNDPITKDANIYLMLADIYDAKKDDANLMATLAEGRKEYPNDKTLVNRELNVYIKSGKSDQLTGKLEEAIKADPGNADLLFTLGVAYDNMANPKDKGKDLPKPANYSEMFTKAEQAYQNAIKLSDKIDFNYNLGALYYNRAVYVNEQMNGLGTSAADAKKLTALEAERKDWFAKALPYFDKIVVQLSPTASTLKGDDKNTYMAALQAAKEIYVRQNNLEKATDYKKKLEAVNN